MRHVALMLALGIAPPPQHGESPRFTPPDPAAVRAAPSFAKGERVVATYYFYWYRFPDQHFEELGLHFPDEREVSYESVAWHRRQLEDMCAAGIDVCLPVYWGAREHYDKPDVAFSVRGLPALVAAADELERAGRRPPRIGLFYDTSTLRNDVRGAAPGAGRADLRTPEGRALFCGTIRDFFCQVPPRHWAQIEGEPLVVLYSAGFCAGFDQQTFDELASSFASEFAGKHPFVVREASWNGVRTQALYSWGAALSGALAGERAVALGPGYDDSAVRGRLTPIRKREEGRFYEKSWRAALRSGCELALLETWNENHEGTSIAQTAEYGRTYIELTARYARLFKQRATLEDDIVLASPAPVPRPDLSWGESAKGASEVAWRAGAPAAGLRPIAWEDGPFDARAGAEPAIVAQAAPSGGARYLYFQVSDWFAFDVDADFELELEFLDSGTAELALEYDSRDPSGVLHGAYTRAAPIRRADTGAWRRGSVALPGARLSNRENGGADLRFSIGQRELALRALRIRPVRR